MQGRSLLDLPYKFFSFEFGQTHNSRQQRFVNPLATGKKNSKSEFFLGIDKLLRTVCCNCVVKIEKEKNVVVADDVVFQFLYKKKWLKIATCKILNPLPMNG